MYLSSLLIDVGNNPDRPRPGRLWLRNPYRVHQRLCMAFPSDLRKARDPDFLNPFNPEDFPQSNLQPDRHVHVSRGLDTGFLFRSDPQLGQGVVILVQSALEPNWDYAFHNASHFLAAPPQVKPFDPSFTVGESFRFRLRANPIQNEPAPKRPDGTSPRGKRRALTTKEDQLDWLSRQLGKAGACLLQVDLTDEGLNALKKNAGETGIQLHGVLFNGFLRVTDSARLEQAVCSGIGPGKGLGFGLLSLARGEP